jgi:hypothetical protein
MMSVSSVAFVTIPSIAVTLRVQVPAAAWVGAAAPPPQPLMESVIASAAHAASIPQPRLPFSRRKPAGNSGLALDSSGNLYIGDAYNRRVRMAAH